MASALKISGKVLALGAGLSLYDTRRRDRMELENLAQDLDKGRFDNWFLSNGVSYSDIAAMWLTESAGNPRATNFMGGDGAQGGSWGLGQVTALTATDYGVLMPFAPLMLYPRIGAFISMRHIQFVIQGLRSRGREGVPAEWVQAYNVGLAGFLSGRTNTAHLQRFLINLA